MEISHCSKEELKEYVNITKSAKNSKVINI